MYLETVSVDEIFDLPTGCEANLVLCLVTCGRSKVSTRMHQPDPKNPSTVKVSLLYHFKFHWYDDSPY